MVLMFGLSRPVPQTIRNSPRKKKGVPRTVRLTCPRAITMPPISTLRRWPMSRSAIQPPGSAVR